MATFEQILKGGKKVSQGAVRKKSIPAETAARAIRKILVIFFPRIQKGRVTVGVEQNGQWQRMKLEKS